MLNFWQDLRYGWRTLAKSPGFAIIAVLTLGLGMAVNTTVFSVVNGLLLRPLPVPHPEQVTVLAMDMPDKTSGHAFSYPDYVDITAQNDSFSNIFAYRVSLGSLAADGKSDHLLFSRVTGNYFSALGIKPALGRLILPTEGQTPNADPIVVLGYSYWQKRFGGDGKIIGKQVELNERPATIVANVLMVRATARQREMAVRAALGAGRARLVRQHLTESFLLAVGGGLAGITLAWWASGFLSSLSFGTEIPLRFDFTADLRVYLFAFAAICFTGLIVGAIPALRVARTDISMVLHEGGRSASDGPKRHFARNTLVVAQLAGSLLLLIVAGLFTRSLNKAQHMNLGFDPDHVLNVTLSPDEAGYKEDRGREFYRDLLPRVRALPGVLSATEAFTVPMGIIGSDSQVTIEEHPVEPGRQAPVIFNNMVSPGYFATLRIPLLSGRDFTDADNKEAPLVAVINHKMAEEFWPKENPVGRRFARRDRDKKPITVVGVVQDSKYKGITEDPQPFFYVPLEQSYVPLRTVQVRTSVAPRSMQASIESVVRDLGPEVPISQVQTMTDALNNANGFFLYRFGAQMTSTLGLLGLILAVVGVYSVVSYAAAQRTQEMGIRMALGAEPRDILRLVLGQGLGVVGIGIALGLVAALGVTRVFKQMLIGITPTDPLTYLVVAALLVSIALVACWIPAHRATRISPLSALRYE